METLWQDVRFSCRTLVKNPGFAAVAVISLALGIGANTTIFTLINAAFLNPLPVKNPSELVSVFTVDENNPGENPVSFLNYQDYRDGNEVLTALAAYTFPNPVALSMGGEPEQAFVELATGNYFDVLGIRPAMGRFFLPEEDESPGSHPVVVMSHAFWTRRFGSDPSILGKTLRLNGITFTVVGVAPEGFKGVNALFGPDLWAPTMMHAQILPDQIRDWFDDRRALFMRIAGRLKPGITIDAAEGQFKALAHALEQEYPQPNKGRTAELVPLVQATFVFPAFREMLLLGGVVLMTIVGLVLLIACSNVANLMLAKATARRKEIAIRLSMGASRGRLIRQLLTESTLLASLGGAFGLLVAFWGRHLIWSFRPPFLLQTQIDLSLDTRVLLFTFVISLATGLLFGVMPALQSSKHDVVDALKEETRTAGRTRHKLSLRNALVVAQVALSIVSRVAAGLFVRSLSTAHEIDPGFRTENLAIMTVSPGQAGYDRPQSQRFFEQVTERVAALPGIRSVSWSSGLPLLGGFSRSVFIEGQDRPEEGGGILVITKVVDPDYFETTGISLLRGRDFTIQDREDSVRVAIINQTMADRFWPERDPTGKRFQFYGDGFFSRGHRCCRDRKVRHAGRRSAARRLYSLPPESRRDDDASFENRGRAGSRSRHGAA